MDRSLRHRSRWLAALAAFAVLCAAGTALAAEVVAVRVGDHPKFTRVVFELDSAAGYRLEQVGTDAAPELRVTLEASSSTRQLRSAGEVRSVKVDAGTKARASISLRKPGLRVQEMILSNPPRIVLDVMKPETALAAAAPKAQPKPAQKPEAKPAPKPEIAKTEPAPKPAPIAKPEPVAKTPPKPEPKPEPVAKTPPKPEPKPEIAKTEPIAKPPPLAEAKPAPAPKAIEPAPRVTPPPVEPAPEIAKAEPPKPAEAIKPAPIPAPTPPNVATTPQVAPVPAPKAEPLPAPIRPAPAPAPTPEPKPIPTAKPPAPEPSKPATPASGTSWSDRLRNPVWLGVGVATALVAGAIVFMLRRRRALPNDLDVTAIAEEVGAAAGAGEGLGTRIPSGGFAMSDEVTETIPVAAAATAADESSFAGLLDEPDAPVRREKPASAPAFSARPAPAPIPTPAPAARPAPAPEPTDSFFEDDGGFPGDSEVSGGEAPMTQDMDLPLDRRGSPSPARMGGSAAPSAASPDVARMLQEFERRIATLEARLDEANEAREKLERQVAAQSEELRVQRAAIARTQRALRTMTRGDEDKATEPALRDGDQTKTRITPTP